MKKVLQILTCFVLMLCALQSGAQTLVYGPEQPEFEGQGFKYWSFYYTNRDGIRLAVDVFLPTKPVPAERLPTLMYITRYVRTVELKNGVKWLMDPAFGQIAKEEIQYFTKNGYACVILDARGSGASFGSRKMDFSAEEMADAAEVMDWIVQQNWSNGKIGLTGISYLGTTAELALSTLHPALKACVPRSNIYDLYEDIAFPGGVRQGPFVKVWGITTRSLDRGSFLFLDGLLPKLVRGVNPVSADKDRSLLMGALREHTLNYDVYSELLTVQYRDEYNPTLQLPIDSFSIHTHTPRIIQGRVPIFRIGGWYDGALPNAVLKGLWNNPNTEKILIGPWDHGPHDNASPYAKSPAVTHDIFGHMLRFYDYHLKGIQNGWEHEKKVQVYNVGSEKWIYDTDFPGNVALQTVYITPQNVSFQPLVKIDTVHVKHTPEYTTGGGSRWNSQTTIYRYSKHTGYPDRKGQTQMIFHVQSEPLASDLVIHGHIIANLQARFNVPDGTIFIYMDEVSPKGEVRYVTEGLFRAGHRKEQSAPAWYKVYGPYHTYNIKDYQPMPLDAFSEMRFACLPISYTIPKGHRIQISVSLSDLAHFDLLNEHPEWMQFLTGGTHGFSLEIPIRKTAQ